MRERARWLGSSDGRGVRLLFLTLCLSEQNPQKLREKNVQKEGKRKLPFVNYLRFPRRHSVNFLSAHNHPEKQEDRLHS